MSSHKISTHRHGAKGFSEQMANELNRKQAIKVQHKMAAKKIHTSKPKQGYTPQRSSVDTSTL